MILFITETNVKTFTAQSNNNIPIGWFLFVLVLILAGVAVCLFVMMLSKNPKDWRHVSLLQMDKQKGNLKSLSESMKMLSPSYNGYAPVRGLIKRLFFEKISSLRGLQKEDIEKLYRYDKVTLQKYINDSELINWLLDESPRREKGEFFSMFQRENTNKKDQYRTELYKMLEKMEKWGT